MRVQGISVIVTTYNGEPWIRGALASVLSQTLEIAIEVIVVDDGSLDGTLDAIQGLGDDRIKVFKNSRNLGTARSRNFGIEKAQHDWIAFNDQDDVWLADKLTIQCAILDRHPDVDGVAGGYARLARDGASRWSARLFFKQWSPSHSPLLDKPPYYQPAKHGTCYIQSLLIKKNKLQQLGGIRENLPIAYDPDLFLRLGEVAVLAAVEAPVFLYRLTSSSITGSVDLNAVQFLGGFAYMHAAQMARSRGETEPDLDKFLREYRPSEQEVKQFVNNQFLRTVNTHWVTHGLLKALQVAGFSIFRHPSLVASMASRLRWWAKS